MDIEQELTKAAASPDANLRNMVLEYFEMKKEFEKFEDFFRFYISRMNKTLTPSRLMSPAKMAVTTPRQPRTPREPKDDTFSEAIKTILTTTGHPMKLNDLYTTYQQQHPEDPTNDGTFRQRLVKRRDTVPLIKGAGGGYWWHDAPLPEPAEAG